MSDRLADLREAVEAVVEPAALERRAPFGRLVQRAARRRQRRRHAAAAAVVAVLGVGLLLARPVAGRLTAPPATRTTAPATVSSQLSVRGIGFASTEHGFAAVLRCRDSGFRCAAHATLLATDDGGRTWRRVPSPADNGPGEQTGIDTVTETGGVVISMGSDRYASADGGRHWTVLPDRLVPGPATRTVPAGWTVLVDRGKLAAFDPLTNRARPLVHQPPGPTVRDSWPVGAGPGHRLVLAGTEGDRPSLRYTDDRGLTWRPLAPPPEVLAAVVVVLTDPATERMYLGLGDNQGRLTDMWRLDRPGADWVRVPVPADVSGIPDIGTMKVVRMLPDGELVYSLRSPLRTVDGGARTVPLSRVRVYGRWADLASVGQSVGGTLYAIVPAEIPQPDGVLAILVSTDGARTWELRESRL